MTDTYKVHVQLIHRELKKYLGYLPPSLLERLIEDGQKTHIQRPISWEILPVATQLRCET